MCGDEPADVALELGIDEQARVLLPLWVLPVHLGPHRVLIPGVQLHFRQPDLASVRAHESALSNELAGVQYNAQLPPGRDCTTLSDTWTWQTGPQEGS